MTPTVVARVCALSILANVLLPGGASAQAVLTPGTIAADDGGISGYQHGPGRSTFRSAMDTTQSREVRENGFMKVIGPDGVFAVDLRNGLAIAVPSDSANKGEASVGRRRPARFIGKPDSHNDAVVSYFSGAGLPRDQIGTVHANTYLSASGSNLDSKPAQPQIDGYASILERKVEEFSVPDSVAWAQLDDDGNVVSEWVYWPAIPARVLADARKLRELVASRRAEFVARLPGGVSGGSVVIRHSSAVSEGPFEAYAVYDVIDRREASVSTKDNPRMPVVSTRVRHFDIEGQEIRLPQERRSSGEDFPPKRQ